MNICKNRGSVIIHNELDRTKLIILLALDQGEDKDQLARYYDDFRIKAQICCDKEVIKAIYYFEKVQLPDETIKVVLRNNIL